MQISSERNSASATAPIPKFFPNLEKRKQAILSSVLNQNLLNIWEYNFRNAIVLFRAPQLNNKFEPDFVKFEGKTKEELNDFVKASL